MSKQPIFKRSALALSVAFVNVLGATVCLPAFAQDDAPTLEEVLVTGYRQSLKASLDMKRDAVGSIYETDASTVRWQSADGANCADCSSPAELAAVNNAYHSRIPRDGRLSHYQERLGINSVSQWRPSDRTGIILEAMYSIPELDPLVQTGDNTDNATVYYEEEPRSARLRVNYRDELLINFPDRVADEATQVGFSSRYNWNENLQLTFGVTNITGEFFGQQHLAGDNDLSYAYTTPSATSSWVFAGSCEWEQGRGCGVRIGCEPRNCRLPPLATHSC